MQPKICGVNAGVVVVVKSFTPIYTRKEQAGVFVCSTMPLAVMTVSM
jgi:hypothetical protein